jgi:hypothetical protein
MAEASAVLQLWTALRQDLVNACPETAALWADVGHVCEVCLDTAGKPMLICSESGCKRRIHIPCGYDAHDEGIVMPEDGSLRYYCSDHNEVLLLCTCDDRQLDNNKDMVQVSTL